MVIEGVFAASRWLSDKLFTLLKLFTAFLLVYVVALVLFNVFADRQKISIKPFAVTEDMEKHHEAAGSIIANIVKLKLIQQRADIDSTIRGSEDFVGPREEEIVSNDKQFLKGENINLPQTAISINDIFEFLSGLFGRKDITGSVFEDGNTLFLQVDVSGEIFTLERDLTDNEQSSSLHIRLIEEMADDAAQQILFRASDKYRLFYSCTGDIPFQAHTVASSKYPDLHELCHQVNESLADDLSSSGKGNLDQQLQLQKKRLSTSSDMERYILSSLENKIRQAALPTSKDAVQQTEPTLSQKVKIALQPTDDNTGPRSELDHDAQATKPGSDRDSQLEGIQKRLDSTELTALATDCPGSRRINIPLSNDKEREATTDYKQKQFARARSNYIEAIKANCRNPFAWANLGVLASDLRSESTFNLVEASVALRKAVDLKPRSAWMWNSLCIVDAYGEGGELEAALNSEACRRARTLEPGKRLLYDKIFYRQIAEMYTQRERYEEAFRFYKTSIEIDPKRTCRLRDVVAQLDDTVIPGLTDQDARKREICAALNNSYRSKTSDEACEKEIRARIESCQAI
jgi:hypothetical protein